MLGELVENLAVAQKCYSNARDVLHEAQVAVVDAMKVRNLTRANVPVTGGTFLCELIDTGNNFKPRVTFQENTPLD